MLHTGSQAQFCEIGNELEYNKLNGMSHYQDRHSNQPRKSQNYPRHGTPGNCESCPHISDQDQLCQEIYYKTNDNHKPSLRSNQEGGSMDMVAVPTTTFQHSEENDDTLLFSLIYDPHNELVLENCL